MASHAACIRASVNREGMALLQRFWADYNANGRRAARLRGGRRVGQRRPP